MVEIEHIQFLSPARTFHTSNIIPREIRALLAKLLAVYMNMLIIFVVYIRKKFYILY